MTTDYNRDAELIRARRAAERAEEQAERAAWAALGALPRSAVRRVMMKMLTDFDDGYSPFGPEPAESAGQTPTTPTPAALTALHAALDGALARAANNPQPSWRTIDASPAASSGPGAAATDGVSADEGEAEEEADDESGDGDTDGSNEFDPDLARAVLTANPQPLRVPEILQAMRAAAPKTSGAKLRGWLYGQKDRTVVCRGKRGHFMYALRGTPAETAPIPSVGRRSANRLKSTISDPEIREKLVELVAKEPTKDYERLAIAIFGVCESDLRTKVRNNLYYLARQPTPRVRQREDQAWEAIVPRGGVQMNH